MPKILKIADHPDADCVRQPLQLTHRSIRVLGNRYSLPSVRVKCARSGNAMVLHPGIVFASNGKTHGEVLTVGGVTGSVHQWRRVLLPMLGIAVPETDDLDPFPTECSVLGPLVP